MSRSFQSEQLHRARSRGMIRRNGEWIEIQEYCTLNPAKAGRLSILRGWIGSDRYTMIPQHYRGRIAALSLPRLSLLSLFGLPDVRRVYAADFLADDGESKLEVGGWGGREAIARTRKPRGAVTTGATDGGGEVAAGVRGDGREARPFFDPKRGQFGANFSGGTGPEAGLLEFWSARTGRRGFAEKNRGRHVDVSP